MSNKKKARPITANYLLPKHLTNLFIQEFQTVLSTDLSFSASYLSQNFLSKYCETDKASADRRRSLAIEKWLRTEATNAITNQRLRSAKNGNPDILPGIRFNRFIRKLRDIISRIVPATPSLSYHHCGYSGGASTSAARVDGHPAIKFLGKADVTHKANNLFRDVIRGTRYDAHLNSGVETRVVRGNILFTVPKNSDIDRVAAKEPDFNMFLQKSFGSQIRTLLKRRGINLNDQTTNQKLARVGAVTGSLATLDLSSASDSITTELVELAMPTDWFFYLDTVRSQETEIDGVWHVNEMFSSMGNGFTFELESLLFYSIALTTAYFAGVRGSISVYGDDIIVPTEIAQDVISVLAFMGFKTNPDKSFVEGPFRESCGAHWYGDLDVTPFYLRRPIERVSDLILVLNQLTNWASKTIDVVDPRYVDFIDRWAKYVPEDLWGGDDLTSRFSLVTGHSARKELVLSTEVTRFDHNGGLLFWLFTGEPREEITDLEVTGSRTFFMRVRRRRTRNVGRIPIFLREID